MGRVIIGMPSKEEILASKVGLVLLCLGIACSIFYHHTQAYMAKCFRSSNPSSPAASYLLKYPNGKYVKEAVDSIYSDYNTCKTYYIKDFGDRDTISHIPYLIRVRDEMREIHPLAGNAIDSLINRRALIEYNKAKEDNTEEAWRLYYRVIPSEYQIDE